MVDSGHPDTSTKISSIQCTELFGKTQAQSDSEEEG